MNNEELRGKVVDTATWAMSFVSDCEEGANEIDSESVARVLDSTSKVLSQVNEMDRIKMEADEKAASRLQQRELDSKKIAIDEKRLEQEADSNKQKEKQEKRRTVVEIVKIVVTALTSILSFYAWKNMFDMHKKGDFMTGTEKDAANQAKNINNVRF